MNRAYMRIFALVLLFAVSFFPSLVFAQDAKEYNRLGALAIRNGNYPEAKELLGKAMKLDPNWAEPYYNAAQLLRILNKRADMQKALKKAFELEPGNATYREEYSKMLKEDLRTAQEAKDSAKVKSLREQIVNVNPEELGIGLEIAKDAMTAKDFDRVKSLILVMIEKNKKKLPDYNSQEIGEMYYMLGKIEFDKNNVKKAYEYADKSTRYPNPDGADKPKGLLKDVKDAIKKEVEGRLKLGKQYYEKGQSEEALQEFKLGLEMDPGNEAIQAEIDKINTKAQAKDVFAKAMTHVNGEKWLEARDMLERVLELEPKHPEAKKLLAQAVKFETELMTKLGRTERLPRFPEERAALTEEYISMGKRFSEAGNNKDAKLAFERASAIIELDQKLDKYRGVIEQETAKISVVDNQQELWSKAVEHYKSNEFEDCSKMLEQLPADMDMPTLNARHLPPDYATQRLAFLAFCYWKKGDSDKAREYANLALTKDPEKNRAKFVLAHIYLAAGDKAAAFKLANEIKTADPEFPEIDDLWYKSGSMKWGPVAIPLAVVGVLLWLGYSIYCKLPEYNKNAALRRAQKYLDQKMFKECIDEINTVKRLPILTQYDGLLISKILAQAFLKTATYDKAIGEAKHILSIDPNNQLGHQWLGFAYLGRRMVSPESLPELLNLYKTETKNVALLSLLGTHYTAQKVLPNEGVEVLERWLELEPNNPEVLKPLGRFYLQKGKSDEKAMKVFTRMLEFIKAEPEFLLGIAKLHTRQGNFDEALKLCEQVLSLDVNNELVHPVLKECYLKMGKLSELKEIYRAFMAENPYNVAFQKGLTELNKTIEKVGVTPPTGPAGVPANVPGEGAVICPHCNKPNTQADYYCQHCGKAIV